MLTEGGPIIRPALQPWDGRRIPVPYDSLTARRTEATIVNVRKVYEYVERLFSNLSRRPGLTPDEVIAFRQMFLGNL
jgi:hypothetical protein